MIATPGEPDLLVPVPESCHERTDEELIEIDIKRMDADDQAIQTILLGLPEDVYAAVDSCETAKEIWEQNIASNLKFLNNLQPEWKRHVTIVRQTKNLHDTDFTQIYDFLKMNQEENSFNFPTIHKDQSSSSTHPQQSYPINNKYNPQPPLNQNFMQPPMTSLEDINDPTEAMNTALILFAKAFQLSAPTNNNQRTSSNPHNRQIAQPVINIVAQNQQGFNAWQNGGIQGAQNAGVQSGGNENGLVVVPGIVNQNGTGNVIAARLRLLIAQKEEAWIQLQAEEFDFMAAVGDLDEIEEVNANCILMANLQQASTYGTQHDKAPVYDTDGSADVHLNYNCYDNEIFNMFTQEEQYTDLLEPIPEPQLVSQNDNHVTSVAPSMVQSGGTVETSSAPNEEIRTHQETVYRNLVDQVAQEDKFVDKEVDLEAGIKDFKNILLNPKPDSFYHPNQKMALGYPNPSYLKKAQQKQQSLYNGNLLLEEHDPHAVYDSEETLELAQESHERMRFLKKEIKLANYAKINHLSRVFVPQTTKSKEELFLLNISNIVTTSKTISIPNEDLSNDTTPSVARAQALVCKFTQLASSRVMQVEISSGKPYFFQTESCIKLMLAPRSARALHLSSLKPHGVRNFPGSLSFSERAKVYYESFKSLVRLWVRSKSIVAIWLEKVVTPLIDRAIEYK
nr:hypothetical protein [Tanacetum cinerariifolium]